jgi:hypothetical protein
MSDFVDGCGHCGQTGTLERIENVVVARESAPATINGESVDAENQTVVEISRCYRCTQLTIVRYGWLVPFFDEPDDAGNPTQIYPSISTLADLPGSVAARYAEMLQHIGEPGSFAVKAGVLLEAVCDDKGFKPPGTLDKRLKKLVDSDLLPEGLGDQAHLVPQYRNLGGHHADLDPHEDDVPLIRSFIEAILGFLYWGPARLARGTAELQRRRDALT